MRYFIHKASRLPEAAYGCVASCNEAGVPVEHYYDSRDAALVDAAKLAAFNPVGFKVATTAERDALRAEFSAPSRKVAMAFEMACFYAARSRRVLQLTAGTVA